MQTYSFIALFCTAPGGVLCFFPFWSLNRGPTFTSTVLFVTDGKSSERVRQRILSSDPSKVSLPTGAETSWQHRNSKAPSNNSVLHWPHLHLDLKSNKTVTYSYSRENRQVRQMYILITMYACGGTFSKNYIQSCPTLQYISNDPRRL